jgi:hypothetical protein
VGVVLTVMRQNTADSIFNSKPGHSEGFLQLFTANIRIAPQNSITRFIQYTVCNRIMHVNTGTTALILYKRTGFFPV